MNKAQVKSPKPGYLGVIAVALLLGVSSDFALAQTWASKGHAPAKNGQVEGISDFPVAGAIEAVVAHPTNANIIWIGAVNGGVFRTDNATAANPTWTPQTDDQASLSIGALELDPTDATHNTLVAGTARTSNYYRVGGERIGILRTTDGGTTWTALSNSLSGKNITGVAPRGNIIVVSVNEADAGGATGLFRSTNSGATFSQVAGDDKVYDLVGDPTDSSRLFAIIRAQDPVHSGIYRSDDTGATWTRISTPTQNGEINDGYAINFNASLAVGKAGPAMPNLFAAICKTWLNGDVYKARLSRAYQTGNASLAAPVWSSVSIPTQTIHTGGQCGTNLSLVADPNLPQVAYVGGDRQDPSVHPTVAVGAKNYTGRLFRIDASQGSVPTPITHCKTPDPPDSLPPGCKGSQRTASNSAPHADSREMVFDANGDLIEVDDGGIYKHTDPNGTTGDWLSLNGNLAVSEQHDVAYDAVSNIVFSGNQDTGTTRQESKASVAWTSMTQADGGDVVVVENDPVAGQSTRYFSIQEFDNASRQIFNSANMEVPVDNKGKPLPPVPLLLNPLMGVDRPEGQFRTPLEPNAVDPLRLILGAINGTYESVDRLDSVDLISPGVVVNSKDGGGTIAYGAADNADALYFASGDNIYVRTEPRPSAPVETDPDSSSADMVVGVELDPGNGFRAWAVDTNQVFETTNGGATWSDVTGNLQALSPGTLRAVEFIDLDPHLIVGANSGVFAASAASGFTDWFELGTGLPNVVVFDLDYDAGDNILTAGTMGRGAWTLSNPVCPFGSASFLASDEYELSSAIRCYNNAATNTTTTVTLTNDVTLTRNLPDINGGLGAAKPKLVLQGAGFSIDAAGNSDPVHILTGDVTINQTTITGSNDDGIEIQNGTLVVNDSTIAGNQWGIYYNDVGLAFSFITVTNSTIANNVNQGFYQTVATGTSAFSFVNTTITDNGNIGVLATSTGVTLSGSLIARNGGAACSGTIVNGGGNAIEDASCGSIPASVGLNASLAAGLAANGCTSCTQTIALLPGSPAIDAAGTCGLATDQRSFPRPPGACDAGAYEVSCSPTFSTADEATLAFALGCYNGAAAASTTTLTLTGPLTLSADLPVINNSTSAKLVLEGQGRPIQAGGNRVFQIDDGDVEIYRTTISNANSLYAAITVDGGDFSIEESTLTANGTGITVGSSAGDVSVKNSTVAFNNVGIFVDSDVSISPAITSSTISDNTEANIWTLSTTILIDSIVFRGGETCRVQAGGSISDFGGNVVGFGSCGAITATPGLSGTVATNLAPNSCNPPCTETIALLAGSPAIDNAAFCILNIDQRGVSRPQGPACDSGAFEAIPVLCASDVYEPDNLQGQARVLSSGGSRSHSICPIADDDWTTFTVTGESAIFFETSGQDGDTRMWLRDAGGEEIEFDDDDGTDLFSRIDRECGVDALPAGTYFVEVDEYEDNDEIEAYNLNFTIDLCSTCTADTYEPDDSQGEANAITSGTPQQHSICPVSDEDWTSFTVDGESAVSIETSGSIGDTQMWLHDAGGAVIEFDDDDGIELFSRIDRECGVDALPSGTYFVKVDEFGSDDEIDAYDVTLITTPCCDVATTPSCEEIYSDGFEDIAGSVEGAE